jgi:hypothetical protein
MYIWFESQNGGTNNLTVVMSHGIVTTSAVSKETAIKAHCAKLRKLGINEQ